MRFEIGPGGGFLILLGLLGLSAAVFFLGMISGREMAQSEQGQSQLASVYPMPAGAPAASAPQAAAPEPPAPIAAATPKPPAHAAVASSQTKSEDEQNTTGTPSSAAPKAARVRQTPPHPNLASVPRKRLSPPAAEKSDNNDSSASSESSDSSDEAADSGSDEAAAGAPAPSAKTHGKGYNIVIDAAMDRAAASRMASRLLGLGYTSHILPTQINGQTWYRVQVGPYRSPDDARAAQAQLRAAYTARYVNRARASSTAASPGAAAGVGAGATDSEDTDTTDTGSDASGGGGDSTPSESSAPTD